MTDRARAHRAAPSPSDEGRYAVLILGMHRSGTSALSRLLSLAGCDLPKTLMGAAPGNAPGHWESQAVADWNDRLLASVASRWSDWQAFSVDWFRSPKAAEFRQEAARLLAAEYGASHLFVLKDPRICRIAPLWFDALAELRIAPRVLLPIRNPMEVAASLAARDGMAPALGVLLWLRHVLDAEIFSRGQPRLVLAYDDLLQDWPGVLRRAGSAFGLTWPALTTGRTREIASFLWRGHRHHVQADTDTLNDPTLALWLREAFRILRNWAAQGEDPADHAALDEIRTQFDRAAPLFAPVADLADRAAAAERAQAEASAGAAHLAADRARLQAEADALRAAVAERDTLLAQAEADRAALAERLGATDAALAQTRGRLGEVEQGLAQRAQELAAAQAAVAERDGRLAQAEADRAGLVERLGATDAALAQTRGRLGEVEQGLAQRAQELAAAQAAVAERDGRLAQSEAERTTASAGAAHLAADRARLQAEADALRAAVAERDTLLAQAEAERASLAERLGATDAALAQTRGRLGEAEQGLAQRAQELAAAQAAVAERDGRLAQAEADRAGLAERLGSTDAALAQTRGRLGEVEQGLAQRVQELAAAQAAVAERDGRLAQSEAERTTLLETGRIAVDGLQALRGHLAELAGALAEQRREAQALAQRLAAAEAERTAEADQLLRRIAERDARVAAMDAERLALSVALAKREAQARDLNDQLAQLESALAQKRTEADEVSEWARVAEARGATEAARANDLARQVGDLEGRVAERHAQLAESEAERARLAERLATTGAALEQRAHDLADALATAAERSREISAVNRMLKDQKIFVGKRTEVIKEMILIFDSILDGQTGWRKKLYGLIPHGVWKIGFERKLKIRRLFDKHQYLKQYPDVKMSGMDPTRHYIVHGLTEGRSNAVTQ